ncbi:MAG: Holliday junction branch migration protein RuvA [Minisyncoccia bacterium]
MIHTLSGKLAEKNDGYLVVEVGGIGFKVVTNTRTAASASAGEAAKLFTHLYVREDKIELYGFMDEGSLKLFELLISVSGIGPKSALAILDIDSSENIIAAIAGKRPDILTRASGVGQKTAERVVLELQSRIKIPSGTKRLTEAMDVNQEVEEALVGLGYGRAAARQAISKIGPEFKALEERLKQTLKNLGRRS